MGWKRRTGLGNSSSGCLSVPVRKETDAQTGKSSIKKTGVGGSRVEKYPTIMSGFSHRILTGRNKIQEKGSGAAATIPEITKAEDFVPKGAELEVDSDPNASI